MLVGDYVEVPFQAILMVGHTVHMSARKPGETAIHDLKATIIEGHNFSERHIHKARIRSTGHSRRPGYEYIRVIRHRSKANKPDLCHGAQVLAAAGVPGRKKCLPATGPDVNVCQLPMT